MDLSVGVSTYVLMSAFLSADVAPGFAIRGEAGGEIFSIGAEFRAVLPSRTYAREPVPGATSSYPVEFDLSQLSALVTPCARYKYFVGCGVAQLGFLWAQSSVAQGVLPLYNFGPRVGFDIPFATRFSVFGFGEVLFSPSPPELAFTVPIPGTAGPPGNTLWRMPVAVAYFGAGMSLQFK
jgi:hypothetical protein